jgi:hypothetical protein
MLPPDGAHALRGVQSESGSLMTPCRNCRFTAICYGLEVKMGYDPIPYQNYRCVRCSAWWQWSTFMSIRPWTWDKDTLVPGRHSDIERCPTCYRRSKRGEVPILIRGPWFCMDAHTYNWKHAAQSYSIYMPDMRGPRAWPREVRRVHGIWTSSV